MPNLTGAEFDQRVPSLTGAEFDGCRVVQHSIQICKLGNAMNANEVYTWMLMRKYPAGYADPDDSYPDADPDAT